MRLLTLVVIFFAFGTAPVVGSSNENFDAEHFVQTQCTRCHDDSLYSRPDRRIKSFAQLSAQVRMCDANLGTRLFDEDLSAVVGYLNDKYYKFAR